MTSPTPEQGVPTDVGRDPAGTGAPSASGPPGTRWADASSAPGRPQYPGQQQQYGGQHQYPGQQQYGGQHQYPGQQQYGGQQQYPGAFPPPHQQGGPRGWTPRGPTSGGRRAPRGRVVLAVLGAVLLVVLVTVGMLAFFVGPQFLRYDVLDPAAVEQGVTRVVTDDWNRQISDVRCPGGQRTRPGVAFRCTATVDGRPQEVPVVVADESGTYEVGQPR